jgi:hypothetical protein
MCVFHSIPLSDYLLHSLFLFAVHACCALHALGAVVRRIMRVVQGCAVFLLRVQALLFIMLLTVLPHCAVVRGVAQTASRGWCADHVRLRRPARQSHNTNPTQLHMQ